MASQITATESPQHNVIVTQTDLSTAHPIPVAARLHVAPPSAGLFMRINLGRTANVPHVNDKRD